MKRSVNSIAQALEGEVKLNHNRQKLAPFKHNLLSREYSTEGTSLLFQLQRANSGTNIEINKDNVMTLFVPHLNLAELKKQDDYQRNRYIKNESKLLEA